jgi:hypothetical protein
MFNNFSVVSDPNLNLRNRCNLIDYTSYKLYNLLPESISLASYISPSRKDVSSGTLLFRHGPFPDRLVYCRFFDTRHRRCCFSGIHLQRSRKDHCTDFQIERIRNYENTRTSHHLSGRDAGVRLSGLASVGWLRHRLHCPESYLLRRLEPGHDRGIDPVADQAGSQDA